MVLFSVFNFGFKMQRIKFRTSLSKGQKRLFSSKYKNVSSGGVLLPKSQLIYNNLSEISSKTENTLSKHIQNLITLRGPITVAEYMQQCLSHPVYGYYKRQEEIFGSKGDFVTAPDVSSLFGEMLSIFCVSVWQNLGQPEKIRLIEIGPGKGTLMQDILRVSSKFKGFKDSLSRDKVVFIETSPNLRQIQSEKLKHENELTFEWFDEFSQIEANESVPSIIICQELFDALPIHQLKPNLKDKVWNEILVDINPKQNENESCFRLVLSSTETPASRILPQFMKHNIDNLNEDSILEISLVSGGLVEKISNYLQKTTGAALIIDYGNVKEEEDSESLLLSSKENSLRGIKNHKFVDPLKTPGEVDLSVDVNFDWLKQTVKSHNIETKSTTQGEFLKNLGIENRLYSILQNTSCEDEQIEIFKGFERIVFDETEIENGMGKSYKCLGLFSKQMNEFPGFK